jgi:hypothetical protein
MAAAGARARVVRRSTIPPLRFSTELVRRARPKLSWASHGNDRRPGSSRARPPSSPIGESEVDGQEMEVAGAAIRLR